MYRIQNCNSLFEFDNKIRPYLLRLTKWKSSGESFFFEGMKENVLHIKTGDLKSRQKYIQGF